MATIKFSDLKQSKKLAEILPLESADMYWYLATKGVSKAMFNEGYNEYGDLELPCWSLAALLDVLPVVNFNTPALKIKLNHKYYMELCIDSLTHKYIITNDYDSPVDACYEMILKLNELNLL